MYCITKVVPLVIYQCACLVTQDNEILCSIVCNVQNPSREECINFDTFIQENTDVYMKMSRIQLMLNSVMNALLTERSSVQMNTCCIMLFMSILEPFKTIVLEIRVIVILGEERRDVRLV